MTESHNSLRDKYDVSCKEIDELVELATQIKSVYGSRITGGGFGGCTVTLCNHADVEDVIAHIHKNYSGNATFCITGADDGARILLEVPMVEE